MSAFTANRWGVTRLYIPRENLYTREVKHKKQIMELCGNPEEKDAMFIIDDSGDVEDEFLFERETDKYLIFELNT